MSAVRERIRRAELESVRPILSSPRRVLELGGGNGFQAKILHDWGNEVTSLEVRLPEEELHYPVQLYDGRKLPFPSEAFDVVFSSHVLEHVEDLQNLLGEASRVLHRSGIMIHMLPSCRWRFWTSVTHYVWVVMSVCLRRNNPEGPSTRPRSLSARDLARFAGRVVIPPPHGVYSSALSELYYYSVRRWRRVFHDSGLLVESVGPAGLFYSGYKVLGSLDVLTRRRLAGFMGSSCNVFLLRLRGR